MAATRYFKQAKRMQRHPEDGNHGERRCQDAVLFQTACPHAGHSDFTVNWYVDRHSSEVAVELEADTHSFHAMAAFADVLPALQGMTGSPEAFAARLIELGVEDRSDRPLPTP